MKEKKGLTAEQVYKRNAKRAKWLKILAPFVFWGCIVLSIVCLCFAIKNSFGNIAEITGLLDTGKYTGDELEANYAYLIEKYGEWVIGHGGSGFTITFINIGNAVFSGLAIANAVLCVFFFLCAYILGKWLMPYISGQITQNNQDTVNLTILRNEDEKKKE